MRILFLGQAGLYFEKASFGVLIDPYLSDSIGKRNSAMVRRVAVDPSFFDLKPQVMIFTHDHLDHFDPETAEHFLNRAEAMTVMGPRSVWSRARNFGGAHNYVQFDSGTLWTEGPFRFRAVKACHSDPDAIGVILEDGEKKYYVTGDTLYNEGIFPALPQGLEAVFLPINGAGNNMNAADAAAFARRTGAKYAVPLHVGLYDDLAAESFPFARKIIPEIYKEIVLP
ncbi:MAG: MBL fold metallo-hydrolase [Clostridia bacterium]|nr:MBL fold metallo-hydrolase [Clostridia bacterium]